MSQKHSFKLTYISFRMIGKKHLLTTIGLCFSMSLFSQKELGLHFMRDAWQSNRTNPAFAIPYKFVLTGIEVGNSLIMDGPVLSDFIYTENDTNKFDVDKAIESMKPENSFTDDFEISPLNFGFKIKNLYLSLGYSLKGSIWLNYPKTLPEIVLRGNAPYIGKTVQLSAQTNMNVYQEFSLGASYTLNELSFGARVKFLNGLFNISTDEDKHSIALTTSDDIYQLTFASDYVLNTANSAGIDIYEDFDNADPEIKSFNELISSNKGLALDLGVRYQKDNWDFAASIIDIGKINWDKGLTNFASNKTITYDGLDISGSLTGGDSDFESSLDTLEEILDIKKSRFSYSTSLPLKAYLSARYQLNKMLTANGMLFFDNMRGNSSQAILLGLNAALLRGLNIGATYAIKEGSFNNLGVNMIITLGPFQLFGITDNIVSFVDPKNSLNFNFRFGGSLVFGKLNKAQKKPEETAPLKLY